MHRQDGAQGRRRVAVEVSRAAVRRITGVVRDETCTVVPALPLLTSEVPVTLSRQSLGEDSAV